jgi:hypothetical protein
MAEQPPDRPVAEDLSCPVEVEPGTDAALPADWEWRLVGTTAPNRATFHISHSDVTSVKVDVLRPSDSSPDAPFVLTREVPIVLIDSLDKFWAGESRTALPLSGLRVPVEGDTPEEAKANLAGDLAAQLRLLLLLATSHEGKIAPQLLKNLQYLQSIMKPAGE